MGVPENPPPAGQAPPGGPIAPSDGGVAGPDRRGPRIDRRVRDLGPPPGEVERRRGRRRASDIPKPSCPWCGASSSTVYRSKALLASDAYRRRRECAECGKTWPTREGLDIPQFRKELEGQGLRVTATGQVVPADTPGSQGESGIRTRS